MKIKTIIVLILLPFFSFGQRDICDLVGDYMSRIEIQIDQDPYEATALLMEMQGEILNNLNELGIKINDALEDWEPPQDTIIRDPNGNNGNNGNGNNGNGNGNNRIGNETVTGEMISTSLATESERIKAELIDKIRGKAPSTISGYFNMRNANKNGFSMIQVAKLLGVDPTGTKTQIATRLAEKYQ